MSLPCEPVSCVITIRAVCAVRRRRADREHDDGRQDELQLHGVRNPERAAKLRCARPAPPRARPERRAVGGIGSGGSTGSGTDGSGGVGAGDGSGSGTTDRSDDAGLIGARPLWNLANAGPLPARPRPTGLAGDLLQERNEVLDEVVLRRRPAGSFVRVRRVTIDQHEVLLRDPRLLRQRRRRGRSPASRRAPPRTRTCGASSEDPCRASRARRGSSGRRSCCPPRRRPSRSSASTGGTRRCRRGLQAPSLRTSVA